MEENSGLAYECTSAYEEDTVVAIGKRTLKCTYCNALNKWKDTKLQLISMFF
jgi:hypothetical protein